ncbi:hypothetical protein HOC37_06570 [bacterium]|jgi:hypothetical protein|nr:hypothetical protein [bacterium]
MINVHSISFILSLIVMLMCFRAYILFKRITTLFSGVGLIFLSLAHLSFYFGLDNRADGHLFIILLRVIGFSLVFIGIYRATLMLRKTDSAS